MPLGYLASIPFYGGKLAKKNDNDKDSDKRFISAPGLHKPCLCQVFLAGLEPALKLHEGDRMTTPPQSPFSFTLAA